MSTTNAFKQPKYALDLKFANFKLQNHCLSSYQKQSTYYLNYWMYGLHSFPGQNLFSSAQTFVSFMLLTFIYSKSAFFCGLMNTRVPVVMCTQIEVDISMLGAWHVYVIGLG